MVKLWKRQKGICPVCGTEITDKTGHHVHHIVRKVDGGTEELTNKVVLHPNCHMQKHANWNELGSFNELDTGLSRVRGNSQARFLGEE